MMSRLRDCVASARILAWVALAATATAIAVLLCSTAAASTPRPAECRLPVGEWLLARHDNVLVWRDPSVPDGSFGRIFTCSPSHPAPVAIVSVLNQVCPSPTGCVASNLWNYAVAKITGPWVVVSAALTSSVDGIGLWNSAAGPAPRRVATLPGGPAGIDSYGLALRSDGAVAFAYQNITSSFRYLDALDACGRGCRSVRRIDTALEPASTKGSHQLLSDVHFGGNGRLLWRDTGRACKTRLL